MELFE
ncbi:UNVERIFIED_CONTAM: hypothetical protein NCL1_56815 [Trichonephila clavipes]